MLALVALVGRSVEVDAARQEITDLEDRGEFRPRAKNLSPRT